MIDFNINTERLEGIYREKVEEHLNKVKEDNVFFMNSKQLQMYLNMSWNSITTHLISDESFPSLRLGRKWLFPKKEVDSFMEEYYKKVKSEGGDILNYNP